MGNLVLNPELHLYEKNGAAFCDSLQVAETFRKRHDNVLQDIRRTMDDAGDGFNLLNFQEVKYKDQGGRRYPKYLMTKDGFTLLTMGYTGKKAMQFKLAYIERFNRMEGFIKSLYTTKADFPAFTEAVMLAHEDPKHFHYSNEINMIYRIVLGMDAKHFREANNIRPGDVIKDHLTFEQVQAVEALQRIDIGLLAAALDYEARRRILDDKCRYQRRLQEAGSEGGNR
jgi:Rha family phage regulatory protein